MDWEPISSDKLWDMINAACARMDAHQERLWQSIRITPEKWALHPWGDEGGGFWVVGIIGDQVLWYNDIEHGFNISPYKAFGTINDYFCNQDELEWSVQALLNQIQHGYSLPKCGPPVPLSTHLAPNPTVEGTACKLRLQVPRRLRRRAAPHLRRWAA